MIKFISGAYAAAAEILPVPVASTSFGGVSDVIWQALIAAVVTIVLAYFNIRTKNVVQISAKETDVKLDRAQKTADATHILVNNNMRIQLKLNMELTAWKAWTTKDPADAEAAKISASLYEEHIAKQALVDAQAKASV